MFNGYGEPVASMYRNGPCPSINESSTGAGRSGWVIPPRWNPVIRGAFFVLCLVPFLALTNAVISDSLGPDPAEHVMHFTGEWVMRFLILVLAATPLARWGWPRLALQAHAGALRMVLCNAALIGVCPGLYRLECGDSC